jgi:hypothetical protein
MTPDPSAPSDSDRQPSLANRRSPKKVDRPGSIAINFKKGEEEDRQEFLRQLRKFAKENGLEKPNASDFAKHLLFQVLYPDDRPHIPTIQALLEDLKASTDDLKSRVGRLEHQNRKLRNTFAESVGILLMKTASFSREQVKQWIEARLGNDGPNRGDTGT